MSPLGAREGGGKRKDKFTGGRRDKRKEYTSKEDECKLRGRKEALQ